MDTLTLLLMAPLVLVAEGAILGYLWAHPARLETSSPRANALLRLLYGNRIGIGVLVVGWLLLTAVAFVYEFFFALIVLYGLIFTGGRIAGWIGMVLLASMFLSTPGVCGWLILRAGRNYRRPREPGPRQAGRIGIERGGQAIPSP